MARPEIYKFFSEYVYKHTGILYKENDYYRLDSRFNTLVKDLEVKDVDELYNLYIQNYRNNQIPSHSPCKFDFIIRKI